MLIKLTYSPVEIFFSYVFVPSYSVLSWSRSIQWNEDLFSHRTFHLNIFSCRGHVLLYNSDQQNQEKDHMPTTCDRTLLFSSRKYTLRCRKQVRASVLSWAQITHALVWDYISMLSNATEKQQSREPGATLETRNFSKEQFWSVSGPIHNSHTSIFTMYQWQYVNTVVLWYLNWQVV